MRKNYFFGLFLLVSILFNSCVKETTTDLSYGIDCETQQSLLCKSLRLGGKNFDGEMPNGVGSGAPVVVNHPIAVEVSAGVLLFIPFSTKNNDNICDIFLQVAGADNYWKSNISIDPSSKKPYIQVLIPKFVRDGKFDIEFSVGDCNGNISKKYNTKTTVSPITNCSATIAGKVGITVRSFELGDNAGVACFSYDMYTVKDRLDIRYNGKWIASTGNLFDEKTVLPDCDGSSDGFVSGKGTLCFEYDPNVSRTVEVYISGCNSGTEWQVNSTCPKNSNEMVLVGLNTSVSSYNPLYNLWDYGHSWISITQKGKTTFWGFWPADNEKIIKQNRDGNIEEDFEEGTGKYARFKYITPEHYQKEVEPFINKPWKYSLFSFNCATFAQKIWKVATLENLDASETIFTGGSAESPRVLGKSIENIEKLVKTVHLRPVAEEKEELNSFNK